MGTRLTALLLAGALILALSACAPAGEALPPETTPTPTQTARPEPARAFTLPRSEGTLHPILSQDAANVALAGLVFRDLNTTLYSAVTLYVVGIAIDGVVYGLDYSTVALIISDAYEAISRAISEQLDRGVTILDGHGYYSGQEKKVILSAIKKRQATELKQLVMDIDPHAFIILQESHQVLGEGFKRYSKNDL